MYKKEFEAFVERVAKEPGIDWYKKINEFCYDLSKLYNKIVSWLKEYIDKGQIAVEWERAWFFTDQLEYKMPRLEIKMGNKEVYLNPLGINYKGELREVSMGGEVDTVYFTLHYPDKLWKVCNTCLSTQNAELDKELDEETFFHLFMKICSV